MIFVRVDGHLQPHLPTCGGARHPDGARVWVELDGVATLGAVDQVRVFVTFRFRTGDERYTWLNTTFGCLKACSITVGVGGRVMGVFTDADRH